MLRPPSTETDCPVIKLASLEQRKTLTLATSPAEASRPNGCLAIDALRAALMSPESLNIFSTMGVVMVPGHTAFTRMLSTAWSVASERVKAVTPPYEAE